MGRKRGPWNGKPYSSRAPPRSRTSEIERSRRSIARLRPLSIAASARRTVSRTSDSGIAARSCATYSPKSLDAVRRGFLAGFLGGSTIDQVLFNIYILKGAVRVIADGSPLTGNWNHFGSVWILPKLLRDLASVGAM